MVGMGEGTCGRLHGGGKRRVGCVTAMGGSRAAGGREREPGQVLDDDEAWGATCGTARRIPSGEANVEVPPGLLGWVTWLGGSGVV